MEHIYTVETKLIQDKTYYFVKKILKLSEFKGLADVVVGYGMHTDFDKACSIAGIHDSICKKQIFTELEERNKPQIPVDMHPIEIHETVNRWLTENGAALLN